MGYLKCKIGTGRNVVLDAKAYRKANGHAAVRLAVGVEGRALTFGAKRPQEIFFATEVGIGVVGKKACSHGYIRCEIVVSFAGNEPEEIEIAHECQFKHIAVEAEVAGTLGVVFAVHIAETQSCIGTLSA